MKLQSALALLIWGTNHSYGNAFASPHASPTLSSSSSHSYVPIAFSKETQKAPTAFVTSSSKSLQQRGGALSSTVNDNNIETTTSTTEGCPEKVAEFISQENWELLSARGKQALANLIIGDEGVNAQEHVYKDWPEAGVSDEGKVQLTEQVSVVYGSSKIIWPLMCGYVGSSHSMQFFSNYIIH